MCTPFKTTRMILLVACALAATLAGCSNSDSTSPGETAPVVLVLGDGGSETHVASVLTAAGLTVRDGGPFYEFTGAGLDEADAVVLLTGVDYSHDMNDQGEAALVGFVRSGGGLVTSEWLSYSITKSGYDQIVNVVLPVEYGGSYGSGSETMTVMEADHPVTAGVAATFTSAGQSQWSVVAPRSDAVQLVRGSRSGAAVVAWETPGRVVAFNMAGEYGGADAWTADLDKLVANAAWWCGTGSRTAMQAAALDTLRLVARYLQIINDGDGSAGSLGSPGDFYVTLRLTDDTSPDIIELARRDGMLYQGVDGQNITINQAITAIVPRIDGQTVNARVSYYENDPGGPQASVGNTMTYVYSAASGCWDRQDTDACLGSGDDDVGKVHLSGAGDPLSTYLWWRVEVDP